MILYTFSKKYAMGGWRLGASIAPKHIIDVFIKLNTNLESCTNHFVQYAAVEALTGDQGGARRIISMLKERRDVGAHTERHRGHHLPQARHDLLPLPQCHRRHEERGFC